MTTREYFQARYEKAERDMRNAITEEERIAAYERRETAKRQLEMSND